MNNKIPKIFVNKIDKVKNNKEIFYSAYEKKDIIKDNYDIVDKINYIFKSNSFIYKKKVIIETNNSIREEIVVFRNKDYLLTINNEKIKISEIKDIKLKF